VPAEGVGYPLVFVWPPRPLDAIRYVFTLPGYLLPFNLFYFTVALTIWVWVEPVQDWLRSPNVPSALLNLGFNLALTGVYFGAWHFTLYHWHRQGQAFKFNPRWPGIDNPSFLFSSQLIDNVIWTCAGVVIWTAYELSCLWWLSSGHVEVLQFSTHPFLFVLLLLAIPLIREAHFYFVHRFVLHHRKLYKALHRLHHRNVNPGPWSGLAMHPLEHVLYFSSVLVHLFIPSHPIHVLFHIVIAALAPAAAHAGFQKVVLVGRSLLPADGYGHYLHHKLFECNYSDGVIPLDRWWGTLCDGSPESIAATMARARLRSPASKPAAVK
jgi:sterol desaturase/sphingolipid hydroxylase (fatty acid hydroxylase superfamily)